MNHSIRLHSSQNGSELLLRAENIGNSDIRPEKIEIFKVDLSSMQLSDEAVIYADGYQMLQQIKIKLRDLSPDTYSWDKDHYKLSHSPDYFSAYNLVYIEDKGKIYLFGASSCKRFATEFRIGKEEIIVFQNLENTKIAPGSFADLEGFVTITGDSRSEALEEFAGYIEKHHKKLPFKEIPDGWCSWYCYGENITEKDISDNLETAKKEYPNLKYIQIDDGYQPWMGDWLMQTDRFQNSMENICLSIKNAGFEPAMWVAPFIASKESTLFKEHPNWFIKDEEGNPLCAEDCTYGGWHYAPWYFLDPTHPEAMAYIQEVFRIMKYRWQVNYFKLDANTWGGLPFGRRFSSEVTSVEAYRIGMEGIWEALDHDYENTFLLGCNAPMWPSIGVVNGMRVSGDIGRSTDSVKNVSKETFMRNWQHGRLWINDPDCLCQVDEKYYSVAKISDKTVDKRSDNEEMYRWEAAFIRAAGGMVLSGDRLFSLSKNDRRIMDIIIASERKAAKFNLDYTEGKTQCAKYTDYFFFNRYSDTKTFRLPSNTAYDVFEDCDLVSDKDITFELKPDDAKWFRVKNKL